MIRLAIYYTPPEASPLSRAAAEWLGRNSTSLFYKHHHPPDTIAPERFREIISSPFHYGFHGTIKPPFRLARGAEIDQVVTRLESFAKKHQSFVLPPLAVTFMHNFFCLRPTNSCQALQRIAADAVASFDEFRSPPGEEELARRRSAGLTPGQEKSLQEWGYPYLMDEFRFHLTLTGKIRDRQEEIVLEEELRKRFSPVLRQQAFPFASLSLFMEKNKEPLCLIKDFTLSV
jgi:hypothetical protein